MSCAFAQEMRARIEAHFGQRIGASDEAAMRAHLPECSACRRFYERLMLLHSLDPAAPSAEDRMASALGLQARSRPRPWPWVVGPALAVASAAVLWIVIGSGRMGRFQARGGFAAESGPQILGFRVGAGRAPERLGAVIDPSNELAFAYSGVAHAMRLLVYGVDEHRHVFWYHPGWIDGSTNPAAIEVASHEGITELPEAIRHTLDGRRLWIHAVFLSRPLSVREVEAMIGAAPPDGRLLVEGATERVIALRVEGSR